MTPEDAAKIYLMQTAPVLPKGRNTTLEEFIPPKPQYDLLVKVIKAQQNQAVAEALAWRPIETAPRGEYFIARLFDRHTKLGSTTITYWPRDSKYPKIPAHCRDPWWDDLEVTHWIPIPPCPKDPSVNKKKGN